MEAIKPRFPKAKVEGAFLRETAKSTLLGITVDRAAASSKSRAIPARPRSATSASPAERRRARAARPWMKWADADMDYPRCWMGKDRDLHAVICTQPGEPVLRYVFAVPGWTQDDAARGGAARQGHPARVLLARRGAGPMTPPSMILAIDTCLGASSVAILDGETVRAARSEPMTRGHQERIAVLAREVAAEAGVKFADLTRIAVTVGPGSFTGLRVGLSFAKGLATALSIPCVGVNTLEALAATAGATGFVAGVLDAKMGQVYLQVFDGGKALMAPDALEVGSPPRGWPSSIRAVGDPGRFRRAADRRGPARRDRADPGLCRSGRRRPPGRRQARRPAIRPGRSICARPMPWRRPHDPASRRAGSLLHPGRPARPRLRPALVGGGVRDPAQGPRRLRRAGRGGRARGGQGLHPVPRRSPARPRS
jgi:tRNA threonylcarbamoyl adenosine modification protein YeaZ